MIHLQCEGKVSLGKNLRKLGEVLRFFKQEIEEHMVEEEKALFPFLETNLPRLEPLVLYLSSEHRDFRRHIARLKFFLNKLSKRQRPSDRGKMIQKLKGVGIYLIHLLRAHLQGESEILCKVADRELRQDEKKELKRRLQRWNKRSLRRRN